MGQSTEATDGLIEVGEGSIGSQLQSSGLKHFRCVARRYVKTARNFLTAASASRPIAARSAALELADGTAWGMSFGVKAAAARLPALTMLPTAATVRKRRRVGSAGSADVFVGGVLSTRSAWVIWICVLCGLG